MLVYNLILLKLIAVINFKVKVASLLPGLVMSIIRFLLVVDIISKLVKEVLFGIAFIMETSAEVPYNNNNNNNVAQIFLILEKIKFYVKK